MKKNVAFLALVLFLPLFIFAQSNEEQLKKLEYDWLMAEFKNDTAAISKMMDDQFIAIGLSGIATKQQELDGI